MQERNRLDQQIKAVRDLETNLNDNVGLIELGEAEGDQEAVHWVGRARFNERKL